MSDEDLESMLNEAYKILKDNNEPLPYTLTLTKEFYYAVSKDEWKDYLSKHAVVICFINAETGERYKLCHDGEIIYLNNIWSNVYVN